MKTKLQSQKISQFKTQNRISCWFIVWLDLHHCQTSYLSKQNKLWTNYNKYYHCIIFVHFFICFLVVCFVRFSCFFSTFLARVTDNRKSVCRCENRVPNIILQNRKRRYVETVLSRREKNAIADGKKTAETHAVFLSDVIRQPRSHHAPSHLDLCAVPARFVNNFYFFWMVG